MRKIVVFNLVSVDGFFAGPKGEIDWYNVDDEFNKFAVKQTKEQIARVTEAFLKMKKLAIADLEKAYKGK